MNQGRRITECVERMLVVNTRLFVVWTTLTLVAGAAAHAQTTATFTAPSDDQWQYPFNGSVGSGAKATLFQTDFSSFDRRDGIGLLRWNTAGQIPPGQDPSYYDIDAVTLSVWNAAGAVWPATAAIEIFGVGYGASYDALTWQETSPVVAKSGAPGSGPRDPYPLTPTGLSAANIGSPTASPWAVGTLVNYTPGAQATPFEITFSLPAEDPVVRAYVQEGLRRGSLMFALSTDLSASGPAGPGEFPEIILKEGVAANPGSAAASLSVTWSTPPAGAPFLFNAPSDDQWQYPFNMSPPGTRADASVFLTPPASGFDLRDGVMLVRWETSGLLEPGLGAAAYDVRQVVLRLWHNAPAVWGATETVQIQLFGVGYGPTYTEASWTESSAIQATAPGPPGPPRDPYPLTLAGARAENDTGARAWAVGVPVNYDPASQTQTFHVEFDLNLDNTVIADYVKAGLDAGRLTFAVSTNLVAAQGAPAGSVPKFVTKEGAAPGSAAEAPELRIALSGSPGALDRLTAQPPTDDRWHYPFNTSGGARTTFPVFFSSVPIFAGTFNPRDGEGVFAWDTSTVVSTGYDPSAYEVAACRVTVWNTAAAQWNLTGTNGTGMPHWLEIFGTGFGPTYSASNWDETDAFVGGSVATPRAPRDPYPINLLTGGHAEDVTSTQRIAWAYGTPQGYVPNAMTAPFPVTFELDVLDPTIRTYLQESLSAGRLVWTLCSTIDAAQQQGGGINPEYVSKEGVATHPGAQAARVELVLKSPASDVSNWRGYR